MPSSIRTSGSAWRPFRLGALIVVIVAILIWHPWGESAVGYLSQPFNQVRQWLSGGQDRQVADDTTAANSLKQQLMAVSRELQEVKQQLAAVESLAQINDFLDAQKLNAVTAAVIGYSPDPGVASLTIQRGRRHGLKTGQAVVAEGVVIGTVARCDQVTSVVRLVTDSFSKVLIKIQNEQHSRGLLLGERGLAMVADYIPQDDAVQVGQLVVTSGLDPLIPAELLIGTIERVNTEAGQLFKQAVVRSAVNFNLLQNVAVISGYRI